MSADRSAGAVMESEPTEHETGLRNESRFGDTAVKADAKTKQPAETGEVQSEAAKHEKEKKDLGQKVTE